jgi:CO dehydrogenase maturation factor
MKISVCGKGGSGKSTVVSLLARQATARGIRTLVVDADESNAGLYYLLGLPEAPPPLMDLMGGRSQLAERMRSSPVLAADRIAMDDIPARHAMRQDGLQLVSIGKIMQALEGCACPMGALSREFLSRLALADDEIALVDMEAGIEHFGRGIDRHIDRVLLVVEPSRESLTMAAKIKTLAAGLQKRMAAIVNKAGNATIAAGMQQRLRQDEIDVIGVLPNDPAVLASGLEGRPVDSGEAFREAGLVLDVLLERQTRNRR